MSARTTRSQRASARLSITPVTPPRLLAPPTPPATVADSKKRKASHISGKIKENHGSGSTDMLPATLSFDIRAAVNHLKQIDPRFGRFWDHVPCKPFTPPLAEVDPFRNLVTSIIGQQVSWMAAKAITSRFKLLFGCDTDDSFPSAADVAKAEIGDLRVVGLSNRKAEYVICLAEHFVTGQISTELLRSGTDEEIARALIAVRGIGQWTVDMFLIFSLRRSDILPVGDLGVQKGLLRWALAAHDALPSAKPRTGKAVDARKAKYGDVSISQHEMDTLIHTPPPEGSRDQPPTSRSPKIGALRDIVDNQQQSVVPTEVLEIPEEEMPTPSPADLLRSLPGDPSWSADRAAPLGELTIEVMKARLAGKKAKYVPTLAGR